MSNFYSVDSITPSTSGNLAVTGTTVYSGAIHQGMQNSANLYGVQFYAHGAAPATATVQLWANFASGLDFVALSGTTASGVANQFSIAPFNAVYGLVSVASGTINSGTTFTCAITA